jgi:hypothetical protein
MKGSTVARDVLAEEVSAMSVLEQPGRHLPRATSDVITRCLLACGVCYGVFYVVSNDVVGALLYGVGYSRMDQAVSELSGTSAASRPFLVGMLPVGTALLIAFGIGVWRSAAGRSSLRIVGALIAAFGVTGVLWIPFPMSSREDMTAGTTPVNDVGHLTLAALTVLLIVTMLGVGAAAFPGWFRGLSLLALAVVLATGGLSGRLSAGIPSGDPTPWLGLAERASIGAWLLWMAILAVVLIREQRPEASAA